MSKIPQYRKVYETLRKQIADGLFKEGDILPSENELCSQYHLTRPTVRKALDALVQDGFIKKQQGKGSIVQSQKKGIGIMSIGGTTSATGDKLETRIITKPQIIQWPIDIDFSLTDLDRESGCIYFDRLRHIDGKPVFYDISYIPNINLPRFTSRTLENQSLFDVLRKNYQIQVTGGEQKLSAIKADKTMSEYFNVEVGHPILYLERKMETNRLNFHFFSKIYCNTEEHALFGIF